MELNKREGRLNCCDIVSEEVSELAKQYHVNCKLVIIDYIQKQFFGSNSSNRTYFDGSIAFCEIFIVKYRKFYE